MKLSIPFKKNTTDAMATCACVKDGGLSLIEVAEHKLRCEDCFQSFKVMLALIGPNVTRAKL